MTEDLIRYLAIKANEGETDAQFRIELICYTGQRVTQDFHEAYKWYKLMANQGHVAAQYNLGSMYYNGNGVTQDFHEAYKWYKLAADRGHANAQNSLGCMYCDISVVTQGYHEAYKWFKLAADQGNKYAKTNLYSICGISNGIIQLINSDININEQPTNNWTFLHIWSPRSNKEVIKILLNKGANPFIKDEGGQTCLDLATQENKMIIESYISPPSKENFKQLSQATQKNMLLWSWISKQIGFYWGLRDYIFKFLEEYYKNYQNLLKELDKRLDFEKLLKTS